MEQPQIGIEPELDRLLREGFHDAQVRGETFTTAHLLRFLLISHEVREAVDGTGIEADEVMQATQRRLDEHRADPVDFQEVLHRAAARVISNGLSRMSVTDVLVALADATESEGGKLLSAHGVTPIALKLFVSHPPSRGDEPRGLRALFRGARGTSPPAYGPTDRVNVCMHNDTFTTQAFVVAVLEQQFAMSPAEAATLMAQIHTTGSAVVCALPALDAQHKIDEVTELAREQGFPLRLSIETTDATLPRATLLRE